MCTLFSVLLLFSCKEKPLKTGELQIDFLHLVDNKEIVYDSMMYTNAAGNPYSITEVKWFVSRVTLFKDGEKIEIEENDGIHYIDTKVESTLTWKIDQLFEEGQYDSIQFTFGFNEKDNISNRFVNMPETSMAWPRFMGGGFHYMMINGKYKREDETVAAMNVHMGIGQIYEGSTYDMDSITDFVHNHFVATLSTPFLIENNKSTLISIVMNIENWFQNPHIYDHNHWGGQIMQNQDAMHMLKENGWNVFSMKY